MTQLFSDFPKVSFDQWEKLLVKELKGGDLIDLLHRKDAIENLEYATYTHSDANTREHEIPGNNTFKRGVKQYNEWGNACYIKVTDEGIANQFALAQLMKGADTLIFDLKKETINFEILCQGIAFEFIGSQFIVSNSSHIKAISDLGISKENIRLRVDIHKQPSESFESLFESGCNSRLPFCFVNVSAFQQTGASIIQQIGFALATAHEYLLLLTQKGYSVTDAEKLIHFSFGCGSNYFYEIAKIRAFRSLWFQVIKQYDSNFSSLTAFISMETGSMNKSLVDPYTNLLRQTTEAMAAISSGADVLLVMPYDSNSIEGQSTIATRMALNISLILKEESYFDKVVDPLGGSYSIELLTDQLLKKSWSYFQEIEALGGILSIDGQIKIRKNVAETAQARISVVQSGKTVLIGINKFPNPTPGKNTWKKTEPYFGLSSIIFERDVQF